MSSKKVINILQKGLTTLSNNTSVVKNDSSACVRKDLNKLAKVPFTTHLSLETISQDNLFSGYKPLVTPLPTTPTDFYFLREQPKKQVVEKRPEPSYLAQSKQTILNSNLYQEDLMIPSIPQNQMNHLKPFNRPNKPGNELYRYDVTFLTLMNKKKESEKQLSNYSLNFLDEGVELEYIKE